MWCMGQHGVSRTSGDCTMAVFMALGVRCARVGVAEQAQHVQGVMGAARGSADHHAHYTSSSASLRWPYYSKTKSRPRTPRLWS